MNLNKAVVAGRLGQDPELKALPSGSSVVSFSVASNRTWKDSDGKVQEATDWHNVVFFGKVAEVIAKHFHKGKEIYVEGRMQTRSWDKDGVKMYRTEVIGNTFEFVGYDDDKPRSKKQDDDGVPDYPEEEINPDDIPF